MDDYPGRMEATSVETVSEAVAKALLQSHDPIDHSYGYDPDWLSKPVSERIQIMRDRVDNGYEAISGNAMPEKEIRDANSRKRMQQAGMRSLKKRTRRSAKENRKKAKADR